MSDLLTNLQRRLDAAISDGLIRADLLLEVGKLQARAELVPELVEALRNWEMWYSVTSTEECRDNAREEALRILKKAEALRRDNAREKALRILKKAEALAGLT